MLSLGAVDENLSFLVLEVQRQVERTQSYLHRPSPKLLHAILTRDDYVDHLRTIIQRKCFRLARELDPEDSHRIEFLKSLDAITANLERIADFCESVVQQARYMKRPEMVERARPDRCLEPVIEGLSKVEPALEQRDVEKALEICQIESHLDRLYAGIFAEVLADLEAGGDAQSLVTALFMSHYFERMGDSLLNIGESILSASVGERIKIDEYRALEASLGDLADAPERRRLSLETLAETRSGCRIDRVSDLSGDPERMVVFKEGRTEKLAEERDAIRYWNEHMPGFAPELYSFQDHGEIGAILTEYIPGRTWEEIVLRAEGADLDEAFELLSASLRDIWLSTGRPEPAPPGFVAQTRKRLDEVYALHPDFRQPEASIGALRRPGFGELIERALPLDDTLRAPCSMLIHGDLNVDNVLCDARTRRVRLLDLHRSRSGDYVQDLSVFAVSHFRMQVFDAPVRRRIGELMERIRSFGAGFAKEIDDRDYEPRMALGLARSFATSARFVLDDEFAKSLFLRSRFLFERLVEWQDGDGDFELPSEILLD